VAVYETGASDREPTKMHLDYTHFAHVESNVEEIIICKSVRHMG
jgi:hypothetical protein